MNLKEFFTAQYLFKVDATYVSPAEKLFLLAGGVMVLMAIIFKISSVMAPSPADKKYRNKFYSLFLSIGLLEMFWYLCRYENVKFFGSHFIAWLWVFVGIVWLAFLISGWLKNYRKEKQEWEKAQVKQKYLPK